MPRRRGRQPMPIFRTLCIVGIAMLIIGFVSQTAGLMPQIFKISYGGGLVCLAVGGVGWLITGFGI